MRTSETHKAEKKEEKRDRKTSKEKTVDRRVL